MQPPSILFPLERFVKKLFKLIFLSSSFSFRAFLIQKVNEQKKVVLFHHKFYAQKFMEYCKGKMCMQWSVNVKKREKEKKTGSQVLPTSHIKSSFIILKTSIKFHIVSSQFNLPLCNFRDVASYNISRVVRYYGWR